MKFTTENVAVAAIDASCDGYSLSWPGESPALEESIARVGVIQAPLLAERGGRLVSVCGLRRVRAASKLSIENIECRICRDQAADGFLLALNVEDNLSVRELTLLEKARFTRLAGALKGTEGRDLLSRYESLMGISGGERERARLLALDALPQDVKRFIDAKAMPARLAAPIAELGAGDASILVGLAVKHRLTAAQTAEFAELGREIAQRDSRSFGGVVEALDDDLDPDRAPGRGWREILVERLKAMRYPAWREREGAMGQCLYLINGTPGITVRPPPFFEGDAMRAEIVFRSPEELLAGTQALGRFAATESARKAFDLL
jgi:ParB-like chromosome segregation protein Spo0J